MDELLADFFVAGHPSPGGSKKHIGRGRIIDAAPGNAAWRETVATAGICTGLKPVSGPIAVEMYFSRSRPKNHYRNMKPGAGRLRDDAPERPYLRPDVLKLARSVEDALTGILWEDDAQIVDEVLSKVFAGLEEPEGVRIVVWKVRYTQDGAGG